jgi:type IV secretory pathway VirB6-like protein
MMGIFLWSLFGTERALGEVIIPKTCAYHLTELGLREPVTEGMSDEGRAFLAAVREAISVPSDQTDAQFPCKPVDQLPVMVNGKLTTMVENQTAFVQIYDQWRVWLRVHAVQSYLCASVIGPDGLVTLGCRYFRSKLAEASNKVITQVSCDDLVAEHSKSSMPLTARIVPCVENAIDKLLQGQLFSVVLPSGAVDQNGSPLSAVSEPVRSGGMIAFIQKALRQAVMTALILYTMFFAIKMILSEEGMEKSALWKFVIQMILVIYFSVGFTAAPQTYGDCLHGVGCLYNWTRQITTGISLAFQQMSQGGVGLSTGLCYYDPMTYAEGYQYLAFWDSLDCRLFNFVGMPRSEVVAVPLVVILILGVMFGIFSGPFGIMLLVMLLAALLMAILIWFFVWSLIFSLVASIMACSVMLGFLMLIAPVFVPMALFTVTRSYFQQWRSAVVSNLVQPGLLIMFAGFYFATMDSMIYQGCTFELTPKDYQLSQGPQSEECKKSVGYRLFYANIINKKPSTSGGNIDPVAEVTTFKTGNFLVPYPVLTIDRSALEQEKDDPPALASRVSSFFEIFWQGLRVLFVSILFIYMHNHFMNSVVTGLSGTYVGGSSSAGRTMSNIMDTARNAALSVNDFYRGAEIFRGAAQKRPPPLQGVASNPRPNDEGDEAGDGPGRAPVGDTEADQTIQIVAPPDSASDEGRDEGAPPTDPQANQDTAEGPTDTNTEGRRTAAPTDPLPPASAGPTPPSVPDQAGPDSAPPGTEPSVSNPRVRETPRAEPGTPLPQQPRSTLEDQPRSEGSQRSGESSGGSNSDADLRAGNNPQRQNRENLDNPDGGNA